MAHGFGKSCWTNQAISTAPDPDPSRYTIEASHYYPNAVIMVVSYAGCTNFEGRKILVYEGRAIPEQGKPLDPHFSEEGISPIARFKPTTRGMELAKRFCENL